MGNPIPRFCDVEVCGTGFPGQWLYTVWYNELEIALYTIDRPIDIVNSIARRLAEEQGYRLDNVILR